MTILRYSVRTKLGKMPGKLKKLHSKKFTSKLNVIPCNRGSKNAVSFLHGPMEKMDNAPFKVEVPHCMPPWPNLLGSNLP